MLIWAGPALAFLAFMFPLPHVLETTLLMKLQTWATQMSTYVLQTMGVAAARSGNVISIDSLSDLTVAEACSGLRMLTIFCAMSVALAMIIDRPWWDRLIILVTAIPIALVSNVVRIVTTGLLFLAFGQDTPWLSTLIHDWAGFAMMPVGLGLLWVELALLSRLTIPVESGDFVGFGGAAHA
jgi:exosortase